MGQQAGQPGGHDQVANLLGGMPGQPQPQQPIIGGATGQNWLTPQTPGTTASPSKDVMQSMLTAQMRNQTQPGTINAMKSAMGQIKQLGPGSWSNVGGQMQQMDPSKMQTVFHQAMGR
jgi:hypothetical protein